MWWFKNKSKINLEALGVIPDLRSESAKERDYKAEEIVKFAPFVWKEKPESEWRKFPIFDQNGSSSCLANATAKALGIENFREEGKFVIYSARDIYTRRSNFPSPGMWFQDAMQIAYKHGATLEQLMPSMQKSEAEMNIFEDRKTIDEQIALVGKAGGYLWLPIDIDAIASVIEEQSKGVVLGVKFGPNEWNREVPKILGIQAPYHHGICATNATLYQGKKAIVIDDSWGCNSGIQGRRIITEDWFLAGRISAALYFQDLKNTWRDTEMVLPRPKHEFKTDLVYGSQTLDVEALQEILKFEELFPQNAITTGFYGSITANAVYKFQKKYNIGTPEEIELLQGKSVGPKTRKVLNEMYA